MSVSIKLPRHHFQVVIYKGHETIDDSWPFIGKMKKEKEKKKEQEVLGCAKQYKQFEGNFCFGNVCDFDVVVEFKHIRQCPDFFGHKRPKSQCFQVQPITCCDLSVFLNDLRYIW